MTTPIPVQVCTANPHDGGLDLIQGSEITGTVIGRVSWDDVDDDPGYVLRIGKEESIPDGVEAIVASLAALGYELDTWSLTEIEELAEM